jgi:hypothetical protein
VAEGLGSLGHHVDLGPTVGPVRVQVAVAAEQRPVLVAGVGGGQHRCRFELDQSVGDLAVDGLGDDRPGALADARQVFELAGPDQLPYLIGADLAHHLAGVGERPHLRRRREGAVHQIGDAVESVDRVDGGQRRFGHRRQG